MTVSIVIVWLVVVMALFTPVGSYYPPPPHPSHTGKHQHQQQQQQQQQQQGVVLKDGDTVMCGGVRSWTCDVNNDRSMVPSESYKPVPKRFLPDPFQENWFSPPYIHSEPENPGRFQRELYIKAEELAQQRNFTTIANMMESVASEHKLTSLFRNQLAQSKYHQVILGVCRK